MYKGDVFYAADPNGSPDRRFPMSNAARPAVSDISPMKEGLHYANNCETFGAVLRAYPKIDIYAPMML